MWVIIRSLLDVAPDLLIEGSQPGLEFLIRRNGRRARVSPAPSPRVRGRGAGRDPKGLQESEGRDVHLNEENQEIKENKGDHRRTREVRRMRGRGRSKGSPGK
jgi:hypothetical protein